LMYLESAGWKSMNVTEDVSDMNLWLIWHSMSFYS
jgi:hypothetical protein